jgi:hypothetical protein
MQRVQVLNNESVVVTVNIGERGVGFPIGGNTNQVLGKVSAVDYDAAWMDIPSLSVQSVVLVQDSQPPVGETGRLWINETNDSMRYYDGAQWTPITQDDGNF